MSANNSRLRRRRQPEQARAEILAAATELIARDGPDRVTLTRVADAAGVTHGLVSHYFGTYANLAAEVLQAEARRHQDLVEDRIRNDDGVPYAAAMMDVVFDLVADERYLRLWTWSALHADHPSMVADDLSDLVDRMQAGIAKVLPAERVPDRARVEHVVLLGLSAAYGYALGGRSWQTALGHDSPDTGRDRDFRNALAMALTDYLEAVR